MPDRARDTDAREDERFGVAFRVDKLPKKLRRREDRLAVIRAVKGDLEAEQREAEDARGREPGREGAKQLHRPQRRLHGDEFGEVPTVLQRTGRLWTANIG